MERLVLVNELCKRMLMSILVRLFLWNLREFGNFSIVSRIEYIIE